MAFQLDERLRNDCVVLGQLEFSWLLLLNNIDVPWFILVPETTVAEVIDLPPGERAVLRAELDRVADYVRAEYRIDKLNIAAIGNIVKQ